MKRGADFPESAPLPIAGRNNLARTILLLWGDEKVGLSDRQEPVNVSLCIDDWAVVLLALQVSTAPLDVRARINETIFECARTTARTLS